jgi:lipopolysaccharide export LptBFGC system permease protein LptF
MKPLIAFFCLFLLAGCEKLKENIQEDMVIKAMTDGQWRVTSFTKGTENKTADFSPYLFQFRSNKTVEAINNGNKENTGTWEADPNNRTITSNFSNANVVVMLLNGTWQITNNSWTFVEASQTVNGEVLRLRIDK